MKEIKLRSMFTAPKGKLLISFDLNQAESWCVAYFANEPSMKFLLKENRFHENTTAAFYNITESEARADKKKRYVGKRGNHMLAYRATHIRLAQVIAKDTDGAIVISNFEAKRLWDTWHGLYHIKRWWDQIEGDLDKFHRVLTTPYGRRRVFFQQWGKELFKSATAHLPQSTVADHMNGAVQDELGIKGGVVEFYNQAVVERELCLINNQGHDSMVVEAPIEKKDEVIELGVKLIQRPLVINGEQFTIPVSVEIGTHWGELQEIKL